MKNDFGSSELTEAVGATASDRSYRQQRLRVVFCVVAVVLGALDAWDVRHTMNPDGISYLDMGDAYFRGDWSMAINALWSPLYSWCIGLALLVLKPSPYWEFAVVHLVNFVVYLCALVCFDFFLRELIRYNYRQAVKTSRDRRVTLPAWAWVALGYTLFMWSSLRLISIRWVDPDMGVAAVVYLVAGILLRIRRGDARWLTFAALGAVLGFGYLVKAPLFLFAFVFLGASMCAVGSLRKAVLRVGIATLVFLMVGGPWIVALSISKGRLTFGDSGKVNYSWHVNGLSRHWHGEVPGSGTPTHPLRKVFDAPAIYEYGVPVGGTYPLDYDPSYWHEGAVLHFDLGEQLKTLVSNAYIYYAVFSSTFGYVLLTGFLALILYTDRSWRLITRDIAEHWTLLIPAVTALGMYALVHVEPRYVGPFIVLLWAGLFSSIRLRDNHESKRFVTSVIGAMTITMMISICAPSAREAYAAARDLIKGEDASAHVHWQIADGLKRMGVQTGDKVAFIAHGASPHWARLARVRVVAEIPSTDADKFWTADQSVVAQAIETLGRTGAKVIVAGRAASHIPGWQRIAETDAYAYVVPR